MAQKFGRERILTIGRVANLTQAHHGRAPCHYCGPCHRGCITRSYFSSINATLPAARATGDSRCGRSASCAGLIYDKEQNRIAGVRIVDAQTKAEREYTARVVFLCASALESARILLNSGVGNSSDQVGATSWITSVGGRAATSMAGRIAARSANGPTGSTCRVSATSRRASRLHPRYGFQGGADRDGWRASLHAPGIGRAFKARLNSLGPGR